MHNVEHLPWSWYPCEWFWFENRALIFWNNVWSESGVIHIGSHHLILTFNICTVHQGLMPRHSASTSASSKKITCKNLYLLIWVKHPSKRPFMWVAICFQTASCPGRMSICSPGQLGVAKSSGQKCGLQLRQVCGVSVSKFIRLSLKTSCGPH